MKIMSCPIMKPPVVVNISFFPNPRLEKEDLRGTYGECGQKSIGRRVGSEIEILAVSGMGMIKYKEVFREKDRSMYPT